ncbi:trafficking protein particle complex subunit 1, putative [Brugia malayi]|uniref:Trafficking protein particle complex subunit n=2 Tax=Brugia TaxID=6278 RepID=A0A0K0J8P8_BRUMA|nr:trafficking protein particle complex subunit 1, putative [Brugia malayi]CRZ21837.1 BMA-TRPP-1 [Brugia malayi]VDO14528.1 unnamed protein product [Brugia timori]VIO89260.1 trafficking protein particle complex subunit 1, putative [Brugia malayi]
MTIFNFYLFNRDGACVLYREWRREKKAVMSMEQELKLMYGMLLSLRSFALKLSTAAGIQQVNSFETSQYKLNYLETPTGLKMVLNTDPNAAGIPELMRSIYQAYVDGVIKNVLIESNAQLSNELFNSRLEQLIQNHPSF